MLAMVLPSEQLVTQLDTDPKDYPQHWHALAVLAGTAVNQDGRSSSLTAPNGPSQQEVINAALLSGGLAAAQVSHLQMHGTGTPLGDPIEIGAASAALLRRGSERTAPLYLTAAKSFMGHAEPAAGIVGVTRLAMIVSTLEVDPMVTLRTMNLYVSAAIGAAAAHGPAHHAAAPRQIAPAPTVAAAAVGGVSAFAFQGTNAHSVVQKFHQDNVEACIPAASALAVQAANSGRSRFWVLPSAHPFVAFGAVLRMKSSSGVFVLFESHLSAQRLTYLVDHAVFGRVLFPAAGMLEAALAAGSTTMEASSIAAATLAVTEMSIGAPLIISSDNSKSLVLRCRVDPGEGAFTLAYQSGKAAATEVASGTYNLVFTTAKYAAATISTVLAAAVKHAVQTKVLTALGAVAIATATGSISVDARLRTDGYLVPPACMDACLHLGVAAPGCGAKVPVAIGAFIKPEKTAITDVMQGSTTAPYTAPKISKDIASFSLRGETEQSVAGLHSLETKVMAKTKNGGAADAATRAAPAEFLYEVEWDQVAEPGTFAPDTPPLGNAAALISLVGEDSTEILAAAISADDESAAAVFAALQLVQAMSHAGATALKAQVIDQNAPGSSDLCAAGIEGLLRVGATENAAARFSLSAGDPHALHSQSAPHPTKSVLATHRARGNAVSVPCLRRAAAVLPSQDSLQIRPRPRGSLHSLAAQPFVAATKQGPAPGTVHVAVNAVGINFRDVLNVLGMYPGDPGPPGSDCAGIVMAVGTGVTHLKTGTLYFW